MVDKKDVEELEAKYRQVTGYSEPTQQAISQKSESSISNTQPSQEIRAKESDPFIPTDLPTRKLDQIIEDFYEKKKQKEIDDAYKRLTNMLFTGNIPQNALPQSQPTVQQVYVKDNSEAIKLIDIAILDPDAKDLKTLQSIKRRLQGQTIEPEKPQYIPQPKNEKTYSPIENLPKQKREYSFWKVVLPSALAIGIIAFGIAYALLAGLT